MTARHHHYLSQCYLKGFTKGGGKKSKLTTIDLREKKHFETIPRNVGGMRDFNRIDVDGVDQNILENSLAEFEGAAASALRKLEETAVFEGETKDLILNLIAIAGGKHRAAYHRQFPPGRRVPRRSGEEKRAVRSFFFRARHIPFVSVMRLLHNGSGMYPGDSQTLSYHPGLVPVDPQYLRRWLAAFP